MTNVYVMQAGDGPVKVGHARDLVGRMRAIQIGSPHRLNMVYAAECIGIPPRQVEQLAHEKIAAKRLMGEWFDVPRDVAIDAIKSAAAFLGADLTELSDLVGSPVPTGRKSCRLSILMSEDEVRQIDDWARA
jgi:hypothetical protein